ncbi:MAG: hypothetical protein RSB59_02095 [Clostridia bacterium]
MEKFKTIQKNANNVVLCVEYFATGTYYGYEKHYERKEEHCSFGGGYCRRLAFWLFWKLDGGVYVS